MPAKKKVRCLAPGCNRVGDFCRGFCAAHYQSYRTHCIENGSTSRGAADVVIPIRKPWEYLGRESELGSELEKAEVRKS